MELVITDLHGRNHKLNNHGLTEALVALVARFDELRDRETKLIVENLGLKSQRLQLQQALRRKEQELADLQTIIDASIASLSVDSQK